MDFHIWDKYPSMGYLYSVPTKKWGLVSMDINADQTLRDLTKDDMGYEVDGTFPLLSTIFIVLRKVPHHRNWSCICSMVVATENGSQ